MVKKETKLCVIKTIIISISNIIIADFRRKKTKYLIRRRPILIVCKQNRAAGGRDATHLPKHCYGHLQPLQASFVSVAVMTSIRYDYMVKQSYIHSPASFQQGMG